MNRLTNKKTGNLATWEDRNGGVSNDGTVPIDKAKKQWGPGIVGVLKNIGIIVATEGGAQAAGFWWFITKGDTAIDAARTVGKNAGAASSSVKEILDALPGKAGKTGPIKTVSDAKALDALFNSGPSGFLRAAEEFDSIPPLFLSQPMCPTAAGSRPGPAGCNW